MTRFLLDTGIASDYINRRRGVFERARQAVANGDRIGIGIPILGELWAGIQLSATKAHNEKLLRRQLADFTIWPFEQTAAEEFGRLFAELRRMGRPMQQVDIQIAAMAIRLGDCRVVTKDSRRLPRAANPAWNR